MTVRRQLRTPLRIAVVGLDPRRHRLTAWATSPSKETTLTGRKKALLALLSAVAVVGVAAAGVWFGLLSGGEPLGRTAIEGLSPRGEASGGAGGERDEDASGGVDLPDVINVLVAGSDSREGLSRQELHDLALGSFGGARPDTIIVVQMRQDGSDAALLGIPRDLRVEQCNGRMGKINAAFAVAERMGKEGGSCLVETVTAVTGIPIHHYAEIDVVGFLDVVDILGGVHMCFDTAKRDRRAGLDVPAGCQVLDGATALSYVRARSLDGSGDIGRMKRQQEFLRALADEASGAGFFANVPRLVRTLEQVGEAVKTDEALGLRTMRALASAFSDADGDSIVGTTVPGDNRMIGGVFYLEMREQEAEPILASFREGRGYEYLRAVSEEDSEGDSAAPAEEARQ